MFSAFSVLRTINIAPAIEGLQAEAIEELNSQKINMLHLLPKSFFGKAMDESEYFLLTVYQDW
ncbi:MAG: hypothetical protein Ct9H300mP6_10150 [Gammaproteobacteria bacterium]|nr:MAG: hypothetical protein Ct9H300mP6_10150 [Gammaproteobacteria bacterium]